MIIKEKRTVRPGHLLGGRELQWFYYVDYFISATQETSAVGLKVTFLGEDKPAIRPWLGFSGGSVVKNPTAKT